MDRGNCYETTSIADSEMACIKSFPYISRVHQLPSSPSDIFYWHFLEVRTAMKSATFVWVKKKLEKFGIMQVHKQKNQNNYGKQKHKTKKMV